jgi:hypothetical protein
MDMSNNNVDKRYAFKHLRNLLLLVGDPTTYLTPHVLEVYLNTSLTQYTASGDWMTVNNEMERKWKREVMT